MNLSGPAMIAIFTCLFSAGGVVTVLVSAVINKGGRRADVAEKFEEMAASSAERAHLAAQRAEADRERVIEEGKQREKNFAARLKSRDKATYDLLEVLETVITPLLPDDPGPRNALHQAIVNMRLAMYD